MTPRCRTSAIGRADANHVRSEELAMDSEEDIPLIADEVQKEVLRERIRERRAGR